MMEFYETWHKEHATRNQHTFIVFYFWPLIVSNTKEKLGPEILPSTVFFKKYPTCVEIIMYSLVLHFYSIRNYIEKWKTKYCTLIAGGCLIYVYLRVDIVYVVLNALVTRRCVQCLRSYRKQQMKCCKFHMSLKQTLKSMEKACWRSVSNMLLIRKVRCCTVTLLPVTAYLIDHLISHKLWQ